MYQHILAPIDGSLLSVAAVGQVVELARALKAKVTFFHAEPRQAGGDGAGFDRAIIAKAEAAARGAGLDFDSVIRVSDRPFEAILSVAEERRCDLIFMSSHGHGGFMGFSLGSETQKVLTRSRLPVLVASVERNSLSPELDRALAVYRDEHRSIAAVVHELARLTQDAAASGMVPDFPLLYAMLHYLQAFPQRQHHPREEVCLFRKLRGCDEGLDALIDKLEGQHLTEARLLAKVEAAIGGAEVGGAEELQDLARAVDEYAELIWNHMTLEDKVIIGHAERLFSPKDWDEVAQSFAGNDSPTLGGRTAEDLGKLLIEIMNGAKGSP